ncbi:hypothetical protein [Paenibacillus wynnii]|uniref:Methyltransferase n=1 Tax=Paenibacillus wynnii TaxID=268407 RepID=A0A098M454_9BACL|nr:hypothetical protein [Paenibacillus wynnii]KGE17335.1 hypothetical protein PWYN_22220 [Paenibacillus wynnii]
MARSWERMVQRNSQKINQQRKKAGKDSIHASTVSTKSGDVYRGRNIVLPVVLIGLGIMYWMVGTLDEVKGNGSLMNWLGIVLYFALAALLFFRRPYLKVERARLSTFKFNRERFLGAADIEKIVLSRGSVIIKHKGKRMKWIFSKLINRYDTAVMGERLEQFATANNITIERE